MIKTKPVRFNRIIALLLSLIMLCSALPFTAAAEDNYGIEICGVMLTPSNYEELLENYFFGQIAYDPPTNTLTFSGFTNRSMIDDTPVVLYHGKDTVNVVLKWGNNVSGIFFKSDRGGIAFSAESTGSLGFGKSQDGQTGISCARMDVNGGTIRMTNFSNGIKANSINVTGGNLVILSDDYHALTAEFAISANKMRVSGGMVYACGYSDGLYIGDDLHVSGGDVTVEDTMRAVYANDVVGIYGTGVLNVEGGIVGIEASVVAVTGSAELRARTSQGDTDPAILTSSFFEFDKNTHFIKKPEKAKIKALPEGGETVFDGDGNIATEVSVVPLIACFVSRNGGAEERAKWSFDNAAANLFQCPVGETVTVRLVSYDDYGTFDTSVNGMPPHANAYVSESISGKSEKTFTFSPEDRIESEVPTGNFGHPSGVSDQFSYYHNIWLRQLGSNRQVGVLVFETLKGDLTFDKIATQPAEVNKMRTIPLPMSDSRSNPVPPSKDGAPRAEDFEVKLTGDRIIKFYTVESLTEYNALYVLSGAIGTATVTVSFKGNMSYNPAQITFRVICLCNDCNNGTVDSALDHHPAADSTCKVHGNDEYWECGNCGSLYGAKGDDGSRERLKSIPLKPLDESNHINYKVVDGVDSTCTTQGIHRCKCKDCGVPFRIILELDPNAHIFDFVKAVDPTCTKSGVLPHCRCLDCGKRFIDMYDPKSERTYEELTIAPLDHSWATEYRWTYIATTPTKCTAKRVCTRCGEEESETVNPTKLQTQPETCTQVGQYTYTATFENTAFETQYEKVETYALTHLYLKTVDEQYLKSAADCTNAAVYYWSCTLCGMAHKSQTFVDGDPLGHSFAEPTYSWATLRGSENKTCTARRECERKGCTHFEEEKATVSVVKTKDETCTEKGQYTYTATFENTAFKTQYDYSDIPEHGHSWVEKVDESYLKSAADCTNAAVYYVSCKNCGEKGNETFVDGDPLGHSFAEPTYSWATLRGSENKTCTARRECERCDHFEEEKATVSVEKTKDETCTEKGQYTYTATFKNTAFKTQYDYSDIPEHGHSWVSKVEDKYLKSAADCEHAAVYHKSCDRCGDKHASETFESGNALGHDYDEWYVVTPATDRRKGLDRHDCKRDGCNHFETRDTDTVEYKTELEETGNGKTTVEPADPQSGDGVKITVEPGEDSRVKEITITDKDGNVIDVTDKGDGEYEFTMPEGDVKIVVEYEPKPAATVDENEGGKTKVEPEYPDAGDEVKITVEPEEDKRVKEITVTDEDGNKIDVTDKGNGEYEFTMPDSDVTIEVEYEPKPVVSVDENEGGNTVIGPKHPDTGDEVDFTVTPEDGKKIKEITVTDKEGNVIDVTDKGNGGYVFTMPDSDVMIEVVYESIVKPSPEIPPTGDNSKLLLWLMLMCISGIGVIATSLKGKKRKYNS